MDNMVTTSFEELKEYFDSPAYDNTGMSKTQMDNFIFAMQITSHRVARQFLNELNVRYNSMEMNKLDMEELQAEREILLEKAGEAKTPGEKKLAEVKIKKKDHDIRVLDSKIRVVNKEVEHIVKSLNDYETIVGVKVTEVDIHDENEERKYWVKRLSKQAGLDLLTSGRISTGNMEAVMALPTQERNEVLQNSLAISHAVKNELGNAEQILLERSSPEMLLQSKDDILGNKLPNLEE